MFPQGTGQGGGGTLPPQVSYPASQGNQWEGYEFAKQGGGGQGSMYPSNPQEWVDPDRGFITRRAKEGEELPVSYSAGGAPDAGMIAQNQQRASLAGLSNQASGGSQVMPMGTKQGMVQAPQSMPMAPGMPSAGLNSLATKAKKPRNITLNQMYRK
jgi:hypothetical protein